MKLRFIYLVAITALITASCEKNSNKYGPIGLQKKSEYLQADDVNLSLQVVSEEIREVLLPAIIENPDPYYNVFSESDDYGLVVKLYEAYDMLDYPGYQELLKFPTLILNFQKRRSNEDFDIAQVQYLVTEYQEGPNNEYEYFDVENQNNTDRSEIQNGAIFGLLKEANGLSAVDANGINIYGTPFVELSGYPSDTADIVWEGELLRVLKKYWKRATAGQGGTNTQTENCLRDMRPNKDYLHKMKLADFTTFDQVDDDNWLGYGDDIIIQCVIAYNKTVDGTTTPQKIKKVWRFDDGDLWFWHNWSRKTGKVGLNTRLWEWDPTTMSMDMVYSWLELDDDGTTTTTSITVPSSKIKDENGVEYSTPSTSISVTYSNKDDVLGDDLVQYCDDSAWPGYMYDTGSLEFWVYD